MVTTIPRIGLGTWEVKTGTADLVYQAISTGYRHIDCAEIYGNQKEVGDGIEKAIKQKICDRASLWVTSKVWNTRKKAKDVQASCNETLKDLKLEYLDLLLLHWPFASSKTESGVVLERVPLSETWAAMESLVQKGLVKHIGVSNFDVQLLNDLLSYCKIRPYTNQVECHPYLAQNNLLKFCASEKIYLTCYSPLARNGSKDPPLNPASDPVLTSIAKKYKKSFAQVMLKWALERSPWIVVIPKTNTVARLAENMDLDFQLGPDDMTKINGLESKARIVELKEPINVFTY